MCERRPFFLTSSLPSYGSFGNKKVHKESYSAELPNRKEKSTHVKLFHPFLLRRGAVAACQESG